MNTFHLHPWPAVPLAVLLAGTLSAGPASAVMLHDPALPPLSTSARAPTSEPCWLSRVGTLFVRCDNLAGNTSAAPRWVVSADHRRPRRCNRSYLHR